MQLSHHSFFVGTGSYIMTRIALTTLLLCACGDTDAGLADAGADSAAPHHVVGIISAGASPIVQLVEQLDGGDPEVVQDAAQAAESVDGSKSSLVDASADSGFSQVLDAGPCDGAAPNGCGGCVPLVNAPGDSCAGQMVGTCGLCNWEYECLYECLGIITIRVCPSGLEACDGRP